MRPAPGEKGDRGSKGIKGKTSVFEHFYQLHFAYLKRNYLCIFLSSGEPGRDARPGLQGLPGLIGVKGSKGDKGMCLATKSQNLNI